MDFLYCEHNPKFEDPGPSTSTIATSFFQNNIKFELLPPDHKPPIFDKSRSKFSSSQLELLQNSYQNSKYISFSERKKLSGVSGLTRQQIKNWFKNRRSRERKKKNQEKAFETKWNEYVMDLVKTIRVDSVADMMKYMKVETPFECPHEFYHLARVKCPCEGI